MTGPLAGRRILITRPADEADPLGEMLIERGAEVLRVPAIQVVKEADNPELVEAIRELAAGKFAWVVFTSPRGVDAFFDGLRRLGLPPRLPANVAAVGPATAKRLRDEAVEVALVADPHTTSALAAAFPPGEGKVLLPRADIAPPGLEDALAAKGWTPSRVVAYHTTFEEAPAERARAVLEEETVDAVVFTSASTVEGFARMAGVPDGVQVVCIGPVTAEAAKGAGFPVAAVADPHTMEGVVEALERVFA